MNKPKGQLSFSFMPDPTHPVYADPDPEDFYVSLDGDDEPTEEELRQIELEETYLSERFWDQEEKS